MGHSEGGDAVWYCLDAFGGCSVAAGEDADKPMASAHRAFQDQISKQDKANIRNTKLPWLFTKVNTKCRCGAAPQISKFIEKSI